MMSRPSVSAQATDPRHPRCLFILSKNNKVLVLCRLCIQLISTLVHRKDNEKPCRSCSMMDSGMRCES